MTQIDFIIKLFDYLGYQFIDERTIRNSHNELWYHNGNIIIDVNFKFETGEISTIGESVYSSLDKEFRFRGVVSEFLKRVPQDKLREFKIKELISE
jgi:hypothetical protein